VKKSSDSEVPHLYQQIADEFTSHILSGVLKKGDKLPSVRMVCDQHRVSMSTALKAYYLLDSKGLIRSVPQSGYYVSYINKFPALPASSSPAADMGNSNTADIVSKVL
jgi:DNA-binding transcriptional regulator YhcF (GntR family)